MNDVQENSSACIRGFKALFGCIVELEIPPDAKIHEGYLKCRASRAIVKRYFDPFNHSQIETPENDIYRRSIWNTRFIYPNVGEEVVPDSYDDSDANCSHGIHFFSNQGTSVHILEPHDSA